MLGFLFLTWLVLLVAITTCGGACRYLENHDDVREALERYGRVAQARIGSRPFGQRLQRRHERRKAISGDARTRSPEAPSERAAEGSTRRAGKLKKGESKMVTLQRWFVEGKISLEQYEREVERLGGSRA